MILSASCETTNRKFIRYDMAVSGKKIAASRHRTCCYSRGLRPSSASRTACANGSSRLRTVRTTAAHAGLSFERSRFMQATTRSTLGMSMLQSRKTSGVQAARSSVVAAALGVTWLATTMAMHVDATRLRSEKRLKNRPLVVVIMALSV